MKTLESLLHINTGPGTDGKIFMKIWCTVGFEPHGRASETWEVIWYAELPQIRPHWKSTKGWRECSPEAKGGMKFNARTLNEVVQKAIKFLEEING